MWYDGCFDISNRDICGKHSGIFANRGAFRVGREVKCDLTNDERTAYNGILRRIHHLFIVCQRYVHATQPTTLVCDGIIHLDEYHFGCFDGRGGTNVDKKLLIGRYEYKRGLYG